MSKAKAMKVDLVVDHKDRVDVPEGMDAFDMFTIAMFDCILHRGLAKERKFLNKSDHPRLYKTLLENSWIIKFVEVVVQGFPDSTINKFMEDVCIPFEYRRMARRRSASITSY
jgi:hypothetical protein